MKNCWVKAITIGGTIQYFKSLSECCLVFNIRYQALLEKLIEEGGLAPDGKTFFDYPTDWELKQLEGKDNVCITQ